MQLHMFDAPKPRQGYKVCADCGKEKPRDQFYRRKTGDGRLMYCKKCHQERSRISAKSGSRIPKHEALILLTLKSQGIVASPGRDMPSFPWVDIVCWGCVRLEVKSSRFHSDNRYMWKLKSDWRNEINADLICLVADKGIDSEFYIFPVNMPHFYRNNELKSGIAYQPDKYVNHRKNKLYLDDTTMRQHKDNWELIEEKRLEISRLMQNS